MTIRNTFSEKKTFIEKIKSIDYILVIVILLIGIIRSINVYNKMINDEWIYQTLNKMNKKKKKTKYLSKHNCSTSNFIAGLVIITAIIFVIILNI